jgi:5-methylcytosine-specific restriction endonuclease McrA
MNNPNIQPELLGVGKTGSSRERYRAYLASPEWQIKRAAAFKKCCGICEDCKSSTATEIHHLTYERFKRELPGDIVALCHSCHVKADERQRTEKEIALRESRKRRLWT